MPAKSKQPSPDDYLDGKLTISRPSSNYREPFIEITVEDSLSSCEFLEIEVDPGQFALALTGKALVPCRFLLRRKAPVGMLREHKQEEVFVPEGPYETMDERAAAAVAVLEVDGWKGRAGDATNSHKRTSKPAPDGQKGFWYRVVYERHVKANKAKKSNQPGE